MSDVYDGYVTVRRARPSGMVLLRTDLTSQKIGAVLAKVGAALPEKRLIAVGTSAEAAWMSPDELLLFCETGDATTLVAGLAAGLKGQHHLALNVSDLRVGVDLEGPAVREVLAKLTPADMTALELGEMRRTRFGQVAAAVWLSSETTAHVIGFRSTADYLFTLLSHAARPGSEVG